MGGNGKLAFDSCADQAGAGTDQTDKRSYRFCPSVGNRNYIGGAREDFIEKSDERNQLIQLKTKARLLDLMIWAVCFLLAVSLIGYMVTENTAWGFLFFGPCLLLIFAWISFIVINIYYEHHE